MELVLNLAWMVMATLMYWLWTHYAPHKGADRRTQLVALALVILIMFPVISVTDDMMMAQSPAETNCCQRKDYACANAHSTLHPIADAILPFFAELSSDSFHFAILGALLVPVVKVPAMDSIQSRPPPAA
jgi:hypothetical protein